MEAQGASQATIRAVNETVRQQQQAAAVEKKLIFFDADTISYVQFQFHELNLVFLGLNSGFRDY